MIKKKLIYLTYDGILDHLGQSQILPYLLKFNEYYETIIFSFEKKKNLKSSDFLEYKELLNKNNIKWYKSNYYDKKFFLINIYNIIKININIFFLILKDKNIYFHIRSYIPFFFIIVPLFFFKIKYIFDMRGFWVQEKIDRRGWSEKSFIIKSLKFFEKKIINNSYKTLCLTNHSIEILVNKYPEIYKDKYISIRTTIDTTKFKFFNKVINMDELKFCYLGTTDGAYDFDKTVKFFSQIKKYLINAKLIIISKDDKNKIIYNLNKFKILKDDYAIFNIKYSQISKKLNTIDIGLFFLKENKSIKASFPTKISEYFFCNKPIICNNFNNDIVSVLNSHRGLIIDNDELLNKIKINKLKNLLYKNYNDRYCRNYATENLTLDQIFLKIIKCYQSIN